MARDPVAESDFRDFVAVRSAALHRTAYLLLGDWALAEDLVQASLIKVYLAWHRLDPAAVEAYTRRVLTNTAIRWHRRKWRGERPTEVLPEIRQPGADPAGCLERQRMWDLIRTLPPRQRAVLVLRFYEDLTEAEIASMLGLSLGTVKSHMSRALHALRARLNEPAGDPAPSGGPVAKGGRR